MSGDMSFVNTTEGGTTAEEFYILSFSYGFLLLIVLVHLGIRWQLRRRAVSHLRSHSPGDKSFKCKAIRQQLEQDFATIRKLSPDPTLINQNFEPSVYGPIEEGEQVPRHWLRMQTCEAAATFVKQYERTDLGDVNGIKDGAYSRHTQSRRPTRTEALPDFISRLQKRGLLCGEERKGVAARSCDLYLMARFKDGIFTREMWAEFQDCLQQLHTSLSSYLGIGGIRMESSHSLTPDPDASATSSQQMNRLSMQPLLAGGAVAASPWSSSPLLRSAATASSSGEAKARPHPKAADLSPLIVVESPGTSEHPALIPGTPV